eukprot:m.100938 g.100938  ORF g.100938 m.100938 type:complete len:230 (+) comp15426_c0_seq3:297-986(+)
MQNAGSRLFLLTAGNKQRESFAKWCERCCPTPQTNALIGRFLAYVPWLSACRMLANHHSSTPCGGHKSSEACFYCTFSGKAASTGDRPGVTRAVQTHIKINERPAAYLIDTPGVMIPNVTNSEVGMKLALVGTLRDELVGETLVCDYLLFALNRAQEFGYVEQYGLDGPCDDIDVVLEAVARKAGKLLPGGVPDLHGAACFMLRRYRGGAFPSMTLDNINLAPLDAAPS